MMKNTEVFARKVLPYPKRVDWKRFKFIDLFAGIGGIRLGFESAGGKCVFSSEWDEIAQKTYEANFGEKPHGDITKINPHDIPSHDILLAGFPCQPFSIIGEQKGFADERGNLFFSIEKILTHKMPQAIMLENVKQFRTHDKGNTFKTVIDLLRNLGYTMHVAILDAKDYGVPQRRERTFMVGFQQDVPFKFPEPSKTRLSLGDILEKDEEVDPKLMASDKIVQARLARLKEQDTEPFYPSMWHENKGGHIGISDISYALRANASYSYLLVNGRRRLSGREMLRLQGFPESFKIVVSQSAIRKQAGNSVAVPVIRAIAGNMIHALTLTS